MPMELSRGWLEIDLDAIVRNARTMAAHAGNILPMVKADAYGHGAVEEVHHAKRDDHERRLVLPRWLKVGSMLQKGAYDRTTGRLRSRGRGTGWTSPHSR